MAVRYARRELSQDAFGGKQSGISGSGFSALTRLASDDIAANDDVQSDVAREKVVPVKLDVSGGSRVGSAAASDLGPMDSVSNRGSSDSLSVPGGMSLVDTCAGLIAQGFSHDAVERMVLAMANVDKMSTGAPSNNPSVTSGKTSKSQALRRACFLERADAIAKEPGFCYLWLVRCSKRKEVADLLGPAPTINDLFERVPAYALAADTWSSITVREIQTGAYHLERNGNGIPFSRMISAMTSAFGGVVPTAWRVSDAGVSSTKTFSLSSRLGMGVTLGLPKSNECFDPRGDGEHASDGRYVVCYRDWFPDELPPHSLVLCVSQRAKLEIRRRYSDQLGHIDVRTVHEAQGCTAPFVYLFRWFDDPPRLFDEETSVMSAVKKHWLRFTYCQEVETRDVVKAWVDNFIHRYG